MTWLHPTIPPIRLTHFHNITNLEILGGTASILEEMYFWGLATTITHSYFHQEMHKGEKIMSLNKRKMSQIQENI